MLPSHSGGGGGGGGGGSKPTTKPKSSSSAQGGNSNSNSVSSSSAQGGNSNSNSVSSSSAQGGNSNFESYQKQGGSDSEPYNFPNIESGDWYLVLSNGRVSAETDINPHLEKLSKIYNMSLIISSKMHKIKTEDLIHFLLHRTVLYGTPYDDQILEITRIINSDLLKECFEHYLSTAHTLIKDYLHNERSDDVSSRYGDNEGTYYEDGDNEDTYIDNKDNEVTEDDSIRSSEVDPYEPVKDKSQHLTGDKLEALNKQVDNFLHKLPKDVMQIWLQGFETNVLFQPNQLVAVFAKRPHLSYETRQEMLSNAEFKYASTKAATHSNPSSNSSSNRNDASNSASSRSAHSRNFHHGDGDVADSENDDVKRLITQYSTVKSVSFDRKQVSTSTLFGYVTKNQIKIRDLKHAFNQAVANSNDTSSGASSRSAPTRADLPAHHLGGGGSRSNTTPTFSAVVAPPSSVAPVQNSLISLILDSNNNNQLSTITKNSNNVATIAKITELQSLPFNTKIKVPRSNENQRKEIIGQLSKHFTVTQSDDNGNYFVTLSERKSTSGPRATTANIAPNVTARQGGSTNSIASKSGISSNNSSNINTSDSIDSTTTSESRAITTSDSIDIDIDLLEARIVAADAFAAAAKLRADLALLRAKQAKK